MAGSEIVFIENFFNNDDEFEIEEEEKPIGCFLENFLASYEDEDDYLDDDHDHDDDFSGTNQRTVFDILESDTLTEDELSDPILSSIHQAVLASIGTTNFCPTTPDTESGKTPENQQPKTFLSHRSREQSKKFSLDTPVGGGLDSEVKSMRAHRTAEEMKKFAIELNPSTFMVIVLNKVRIYVFTSLICLLYFFQERLCNDKCCFQNQLCIPITQIGEIVKIQSDYWGSAGTLPPMNKERKEKCIKLFEKALYDHG